MPSSTGRVRAVDMVGILVVVAVGAVTLRENASRSAHAEAALLASGARVYCNANGVAYAVALNDKPSVSNEVFEAVSTFRGVETLSLSRSRFDGTALSSLCALPALRSLSLYDTTTCDADLVLIEACRSLEVLSLDGTDVTSSGVMQLRSLRRLQCLTVARTEVDDRCIECLAAIGSLRFVDLRETKVTRSGAAKLKSLRPDVTLNIVLD